MANHNPAWWSKERSATRRQAARRIACALAGRSPHRAPKVDTAHEPRNAGYGRALNAWLPLVESIIAREFPRIPVRYAMRWMEIESGGNPCSFGSPKDLGPDGNPREMGLGQLYNPDDFTALGLEPARFRAYCVPGTQTPSRALTEEERAEQVRDALLRKIQECVERVDRVVAAYTLPWSTDSFDFWALVKARHALPAIIGRGIPSVVQVLGRPPSNWTEFRLVLGMDNRRPDGTPKHPQWVHALDNCEKTARVMLEPAAPRVA
jgi:hypothetical protein